MYKNNFGNFAFNRFTDDYVEMTPQEVEAFNKFGAKAFIISEAGCVLNENFSDEQIESERIKQVEEIKSQLEILDFKTVRPLRAILTDCATDEDREVLRGIETQASVLREELSSFL